MKQRDSGVFGRHRVRAALILALATGACGCTAPPLRLDLAPPIDEDVIQGEVAGVSVWLRVPPLRQKGDGGRERHDALWAYAAEFRNDSDYVALIRRSRLLLVLETGDAVSPVGESDALSTAVRPVKVFREYAKADLARQYCEWGIDSDLVVRPGATHSGVLFFKVPWGNGAYPEGVALRVEVQFLKAARTARVRLPLGPEMEQ